MMLTNTSSLPWPPSSWAFRLLSERKGGCGYINIDVYVMVLQWDREGGRRGYEGGEGGWGVLMTLWVLNLHVYTQT